MSSTHEPKTIKLAELCNTLGSVTIDDRLAMEHSHTLVTPYPLTVDILNPEIKTDLSCLRYLMLQIDTNNNKVMIELDHLKTLLPMLSQLLELHVCVQGHGFKNDDQFFPLIESAKLVNLKDFEMIAYHDGIFDGIPLGKNYECFNGGIHLERLAGIELHNGPVVNLIRYLARRFPKLKHLALGSDMGLSEKLAVDNISKECMITSVQSLTVCSKYGSWCELFLLLHYMPNIVAVDLSLQYRTCYGATIELDILCKLGEMLPNLAALKLPWDGHMSYEMQSGILSLLRTKMRNLKVLVIPTTNYNAEDDARMSRWLDRNMDQLRKELPKLYSLIGIHSDRLKALPNLSYMSGPYGHNQTLARQVGPRESGAEPAAKRQKVTRWNSVVEYTNEWHKAHGTSFFYPETSIHNIRSTKQEQRAFRDRMIALHRDSDSDSDRHTCNYTDSDTDLESDP